MKRTFAILAMMLMVFTVNAQEWERQDVKGDELLGTTDGVKWRYQDGDFLFAFMEGEQAWKVGIGRRDVFEPDKRKMSKKANMLTHATIGFYNEAGELVKKVDDCILELTQMMRVGETMKKWIWDDVPRGYGVNEYLQNEKGYVRIVVPLHITGNFDLKLPCMTK